MRRLLVLGPLAVLLLGGCFESRDALLLDPAAGAAPLQDGTYVADDQDKTVLTVTRQGTWYKITEGGEDTDLLLTPLPGEGLYAAAVGQGGCAQNATSCTWDYAVVKVDGDRAQLIQPMCETDSGLVGAWLSSLSADADICYFTSGDNLRQALSEIAAQRTVTTTYTRR